MIVTENNVETLITVLTLLSEKNCTVADAQDILSYASNVIRNKAPVPQFDYKQELDYLFKALSENEE